MYTYNKGTSKNNRLRFIVIATTSLVAVLLLVSGVFVYRHYHKKAAVNSTGAGPIPSPTQSPESVEADTDAANNQKETLDKNGNPAPSPTPSTQSGKKAVTPNISSASTSEVRAYIPGITEEGGTCTLVLSKAGSNSITSTQSGFADASTTICAPFAVSGLSTGEWTAVVSYSSNSSQGSSVGSKIVIP